MFFKKKRNSFVDDEEILLAHLLTLNRDSKNKIFLSLNSYKKIDGWEPKRFVQTLFLLRDMGYLELYFYGRDDESAACDVTMRESAITYFEDQELDKKEAEDNRAHDYKVALFSGLLGYALGLLTTIIT